MTDAEVIKEVMGKFDEYRAKWVAKFGNDTGFNKWFITKI